MKLDELQSVQSRERQASSLQHLRASFYEEAGEFIGELREERNAEAAASDNPFDDEKVERLSDEIRTAERTVESIYERRVGKVVKLASIAAAGMPYDDEGLTTEEERLFETLVERIERNRECVLSVLGGESPGLDCTPAERDEDRTPTGTGTRTGTGTGGETRSGTGVETPTPADRPPGNRDPVDRDDGARPAREPEAVGSGTAEPSATAPGPEPETDSMPETDSVSETDPVSETDHGKGTDGDGPTPPDEPVDRTVAGRTVEEAGPDQEPEDVLDIGSAMGGSTDGARGERGEPEPARTASPESDSASATGSGDGSPGRDSSAPGGAGSAPRSRAGDATEASPDDETPESVDRTTVRVTVDVGNIYGVDGRSYDLSAEDVVTLPARNAENLVSKRAAERLD